MAQQTAINGNRYSFTSVSVNIAGQDIAKGVFTSINYKATQEPGVVQGNKNTVTGLTAGYAQGSGSFEMLASELDDFYAQLTQNGLFPIMSVDFDIVVSYSENQIDVRTDVLRGCRITDVDSPNAKGTDGTVKNNTLFIRRVLLNGIPAFADPAF